MKKNTTLVLWWGLGTRGTESKIRLVGDRSTNPCAWQVSSFEIISVESQTPWGSVSSEGVCASLLS